jgi:hypothetical protein
MYQLDEKLTQLKSVGFDPGGATTDVIYARDGAYRIHEFAILLAHPALGVHEVHGAIADRYWTEGGPEGYLGYPRTDELAAGIGAYNRFEFQGSGLLYHPNFGTRAVGGLIGEYYFDTLGGPEGGWGSAVTDEYADGEGRANDFEAGTLYCSADGGILEIYAPEPVQLSPDVDWTTVGGSDRLAYAVKVLVDRYGYPANGAAGMVGNLWAESGVLPSRIEGSASTTPMRARGFDGQVHDFSAAEIMDRDSAAQRGPRLPGVGLAQWTSSTRRAKLFTHEFNGQVLRTNVLFSMDGQLDYLVGELSASYPGVNAAVANPGVTVDDACGDVVYRFEVPGAILDGGNKLPREDPRVQQVFRARRAFAQRALNEFRCA